MNVMIIQLNYHVSSLCMWIHNILRFLIYIPVALFAPKKLKDTPAVQPPTPQPPPQVQLQQRVMSAWTEDDDLCLIQLIVQYSFNWDLICDALNATRVPVNGEKRTPWDCHERWKQNNLTSLSGQVNSGMYAKGVATFSLSILLKITHFFHNSICIEAKEGFG